MDDVIMRTREELMKEFSEVGPSGQNRLLLEVLIDIRDKDKNELITLSVNNMTQDEFETAFPATDISQPKKGRPKKNV